MSLGASKKLEHILVHRQKHWQCHQKLQLLLQLLSRLWCIRVHQFKFIGRKWFILKWTEATNFHGFIVVLLYISWSILGCHSIYCKIINFQRDLMFADIFTIFSIHKFGYETMHSVVILYFHRALISEFYQSAKMVK